MPGRWRCVGEEGFVSGVYGCEVVQIFHNTVVLTISPTFRPAASTIAFSYPATDVPVQRRLPVLHPFSIYRDLTGGDDHIAQINALYVGPIAAGAFSVAIVLLMISPYYSGKKSGSL